MILESRPKIFGIKTRKLEGKIYGERKERRNSEKGKTFLISFAGDGKMGKE